MNIANNIPIILATLILNINANVILTTLKSKTIGSCSPNVWLYESHHNQSTLDASCPNNPPTTNPDKINTNNILFLNHNQIYFIKI